jgi:hypothetical protein
MMSQYQFRSSGYNNLSSSVQLRIRCLSAAMLSFTSFLKTTLIKSVCFSKSCRHKLLRSAARSSTFVFHKRGKIIGTDELLSAL